MAASAKLVASANLPDVQEGLNENVSVNVIEGCWSACNCDCGGTKLGFCTLFIELELAKSILCPSPLPGKYWGRGSKSAFGVGDSSGVNVY